MNIGKLTQVRQCHNNGDIPDGRYHGWWRAYEVSFLVPEGARTYIAKSDVGVRGEARCIVTVRDNRFTVEEE